MEQENENKRVLRAARLQIQADLLALTKMETIDDLGFLIALERMATKWEITLQDILHASQP